MDSKKLSECKPVVLKPFKGKVSQIPPYPESTDSAQSVKLEESNDPSDIRCGLAYLFGGDLTTGKWKHYLSEHDLETAPRHYRRTLKNEGWHVSLESFIGDLQYGVYRRDYSSYRQNIIVLFFQESELTHILPGYKRE